MIVRTRIFELCNGRYKNLCELAQAMGISVSQLYRVRQGKRQINQKFIVGAMQVFPNSRLDDLFYLVPDSSTTTNPCGSAADSISGAVVHEKDATSKYQL